jgi:hypothetical protein
MHEAAFPPGMHGAARRMPRRRCRSVRVRHTDTGDFGGRIINNLIIITPGESGKRGEEGGIQPPNRGGSGSVLRRSHGPAGNGPVNNPRKVSSYLSPIRRFHSIVRLVINHPIEYGLFYNIYQNTEKDENRLRGILFAQEVLICIFRTAEKYFLTMM